MRHTAVLTTCLLAVLASPAAAEELLLPVFAYNVKGLGGNLWSSEVYLTNPGEVPVQVTLAQFLPGTLERPAPCDLFMPPTRVVPPTSAVLWTAAGLATDLGCAERALGAVVLSADGPVHVSSRTVNHAPSAGGPPGVLVGIGQDVEAIPIGQLPRPGRHLLPALIWHRNPCGVANFETLIGFANPASGTVTVTIDLPGEAAEREILVNGDPVTLPYSFKLWAQTWRQLRLGPIDLSGDDCLPPESFMVQVDIDQPAAIFASVVDRISQDARTVKPVPLGPAPP